jgi:hypothetical protein
MQLEFMPSPLWGRGRPDLIGTGEGVAHSPYYAAASGMTACFCLNKAAARKTLTRLSSAIAGLVAESTQIKSTEFGIKKP